MCLAVALQIWEGLVSSTPSTLGTSNLSVYQLDVCQLPNRRLNKRRCKRCYDRGVNEPCQSSWESPVVLVTWKYGTICFCVDYRKLNDVTRKDAYPLPRIDDTLDSLNLLQHPGSLLRILAGGYGSTGH